jgi:hypothetical protein
VSKASSKADPGQLFHKYILLSSLALLNNRPGFVRTRRCSAADLLELIFQISSVCIFAGVLFLWMDLVSNDEVELGPVRGVLHVNNIKQVAVVARDNVVQDPGAVQLHVHQHPREEVDGHVPLIAIHDGLHSDPLEQRPVHTEVEPKQLPAAISVGYRAGRALLPSLAHL